MPSESKPDASKVKAKLVRDSFTMPKLEYAQITGVKQRAAKLGRPTKKSEVLRAAVALLNTLPDTALLAALQALPSIKTGRPKATQATQATAPVVDVAKPAQKQAAKPAAKKAAPAKTVNKAVKKAPVATKVAEKVAKKVARKVAAKRAPATKSA